jgi:hypothetical protein
MDFIRAVDMITSQIYSLQAIEPKNLHERSSLHVELKKDSKSIGQIPV